jgi:hypothetical protein
MNANRNFLIIVLLSSSIAFVYAQASEKLSAKYLGQANPDIHWPAGFAPKDVDVFVHNQIEIEAPAKIIWENLVNAGQWPSWYANSADVHIDGSDPNVLRAGGHFTWKIFGFRVATDVGEYVPERRLGWTGGDPSFLIYHTWLIIPQGDHCLVVTEESQKGAAAIKFRVEQPNAMYDGHDWWLSALKARSEEMAKRAKENVAPVSLKTN